MGIIVGRLYTLPAGASTPLWPCSSIRPHGRRRSGHRLSRPARTAQVAGALAGAGVGRSDLASVLAHKACRHGFSAFNQRAAGLFRDPPMARAGGSWRTMLLRLSTIDLLVINHWAKVPVSGNVSNVTRAGRRPERATRCIHTAMAFWLHTVALRLTRFVPALPVHRRRGAPECILQQLQDDWPGLGFGG